MTRAVIVDSVRTGITKAFQGELRDSRSDDLAALCIDSLLARNPQVEPNRIEDCLVGCAFAEGVQGLNFAKNVALASRLEQIVPGCTISRYCASGLDAVAVAASRIMSGMSDAMVAGGAESVSLILPSVNTSGFFNPRIIQSSPDSCPGKSPQDSRTPFWKAALRSMAMTADALAERFEITRAAQDEYACISQARTAAAQQRRSFAEELVCVPIVGSTPVDSDRCNRPDTDLESLASLEPALCPTGTVTAGNSAPPADGAAAALLVNEELALTLDLAKLGYFVGYATVACEPKLMGLGPSLAIPRLLHKHSLSLSQIDLLEINEAFAAQMVHCVRALRIDPERVNVNGGAISLGHPFGMTGVRLVGHLLRELRRRGGRLGVVALCVGGGMGVAALVEAYDG